MKWSNLSTPFPINLNDINAQKWNERPTDVIETIKSKIKGQEKFKTEWKNKPILNVEIALIWYNCPWLLFHSWLELLDTRV